jgi:hypothetical protein
MGRKGKKSGRANLDEIDLRELFDGVKGGLCGLACQRRAVAPAAAEKPRDLFQIFRTVLGERVEKISA